MHGKKDTDMDLAFDTLDPAHDQCDSHVLSGFAVPAIYLSVCFHIVSKETLKGP